MTTFLFFRYLENYKFKLSTKTEHYTYPPILCVHLDKAVKSRKIKPRETRHLRSKYLSIFLKTGKVENKSST